MKGIDLRTVQELAGHKSIQMTCRYAHLAPGHEQTAVEMLVKKSAAPRRKRTVRPTATTTATGQIVANNARQLQFSKPLQVMGLGLVGPPGFEPGTNGLWVHCSNRWATGPLEGTSMIAKSLSEERQ